MPSVFFQRIFMQRIKPRTSELRILNARIKFIWTASKTCPFEFQPLKWQKESNDYIKTQTSYVFVERKTNEKRAKRSSCHCSVIFKISYESFRHKNLFFYSLQPRTNASAGLSTVKLSIVVALSSIRNVKRDIASLSQQYILPLDSEI